MRFVRKVATEAVECAGTANETLREEPTDALIADAVRHSLRDNQTSAGLFLKTVPQCVRTWGDARPRGGGEAQADDGV
jgi:hypothetical protein